MEELIGNRRIVLWGTGNTGNKFYQKYKDIMPIRACTSNDKEIVPIQQLPVIQHEDVNKKNDFVIICSIYYKEIRTQLMLEGWEVNKDFVSYDFFQILYELKYENKKLIVFVGQCDIQDISIALNRLKSFRKDYAVWYYNERAVCKNGDLFHFEEAKECASILGKADYFIKPSSISPRISFGFNDLLKKLNEKCIVITIPLFHFDSYWPNDIAKERSINKYYMTKGGMKLSAYVERDQVIEHFVDEGMSVKEIMTKISSDSFFDPGEVVKNHENCIKRIRLSDRLSSIKIADYIAEHYNTDRLFCDRGHFEKTLLIEYVRRLLVYLDKRECTNELEDLDMDWLFAYVNELPIYPGASKILNLEWVNKDTVYRQRRYDGVKLVTFEEYMESFIKYCKTAKDILGYCYHDYDDNGMGEIK